MLIIDYIAKKTSMRLFKPEVYQGGSKPTKYFEGWYYKQVSDDEGNVFAFIPGVSLNKEDPHSFIQFINGLTGETHNVKYPLNKFSYSRKKLEVRVGNSFFSGNMIDVDIKKDGFSANGTLSYLHTSPFPKTFFSPGIMGWYSFVPFMECKHGVVSMNHYVNGTMTLNDNLVEFEKGKGYIEKDWGRSFPSAWIWMQSNNFSETGASVMLSVARIPWLGSYFMGFLSFFHLHGVTWVFATYNGSKFRLESYTDERINVELTSNKAKLNISMSRKKSGELLAPQEGKMNRIIKESVDSEVEVELKEINGNTLFKGKGRRAGLEVTSNIFDLLKKT